MTISDELTFRVNEVGVGSWNIDGIWRRINGYRYNKLNDPFVLDQITRDKIFCISETHHIASEEGLLHIPDYKCFSICRPKDKNVRRHKASGGLAAYVHTSIRPGVAKVPLPGTEILVLKLKKHFFGLDNDIF